MNDRDFHVVNQVVETMIAFLKQSKLVIKLPSVTRSRVTGIVPVKAEEFFINPKVYLSHPKSKKKYLVQQPSVFCVDHNEMPEIFSKYYIREMIHKANVGAYWPENFWSGRTLVEKNTIHRAVDKKIAECKLFRQFREEAEKEWSRCENEKKSLLAGYLGNSKKKNKIRSAFHEKLTDLLINVDSIRNLDQESLLKLFQVDSEELMKLAEFVKRYKKELRFISNEDIDKAQEDSQIRFVMKS